MMYPYEEEPFKVSREPDTLWEHLCRLRWYNEFKLADKRLRLVAQHFDDPIWLRDKTEEWVNEREYWNGYYGGAGFQQGGWNWYD